MQVYQEILAVSRRHALEASFSQYYAYSGGWPRWLRWLPECHWWLSYAHRGLRTL
jgi:hypothetical protein